MSVTELVPVPLAAQPLPMNPVLSRKISVGPHDENASAAAAQAPTAISPDELSVTARVKGLAAAAANDAPVAFLKQFAIDDVSLPVNEMASRYPSMLLAALQEKLRVWFPDTGFSNPKRWTLWLSVVACDFSSVIATPFQVAAGLVIATPLVSQNAAHKQVALAPTVRFVNVCGETLSLNTRSAVPVASTATAIY